MLINGPILTNWKRKEVWLAKTNFLFDFQLRGCQYCNPSLCFDNHFKSKNKINIWLVLNFHTLAGCMIIRRDKQPYSLLYKSIIWEPNSRISQPYLNQLLYLNQQCMQTSVHQWFFHIDYAFAIFSTCRIISFWFILSP